MSGKSTSGARGVGFLQLVLAVAVILLLTLLALRLYERSPLTAGSAGTPASQVPLERATLSLEGVTAEVDALQAADALRRVPGVVSARVDSETGVARVTFNPGLASRADLVRAVRRAGYRVAP